MQKSKIDRVCSHLITVEEFAEHYAKEQALSQLQCHTEK